MGIYKKLWVTSYLKIGSPKIRKKARMYVLPTFAQHYAGGSAAAAAKSLQLCLTLCDPIDSSLPGSLTLEFSRQEHWSGLPLPSPMHESEK